MEVCVRLGLVPRTTEFYDLFEAAGANAHAASRLVERRFRELADGSVEQESVKALEHEGDRLTRELITLINTQYLTPFDRDDIYQLARAVDDITDHIEHASDLLTLYRIERVMPASLELCRVLVGATEGLECALRSLASPKGVDPFLVQIKGLEDEGDRIVREAIAGLFDDEAMSAKTLIRWKDVYDALEDAIDACDTAANLIGNIVVKNA
jgi:predicted phosphate transport protein (TIGR00153 family)